MTPTIEIRPRRDEDLPALGEVLARVHDLDGYPVEGVADPIGWLQVDHAIECWTATVDGQPVGHVALTQATPEDDAAKVWAEHTGGDIADLAIPVRLFVDPDHRKLGLGRQLMEAVDTEAQQLGKSLALDVIEKDHAAQRLYRHLGYTMIGSTAHVLSDGSVYLANVLTLSAETSLEDYVDQAVIEFRPAHTPDDIDQNWTLLLILEPGEWPDQALREIARTTLKSAGLTDGLILTTRRTQSSWGADGSTTTLLVEFAVSLIETGVVGLAGYLANSYRRKYSTRHTPSSMTEEDATEWALQRVPIRYEVARRDLTVRGTGVSGPNVSVQLQDSSGVAYDVVICGIGPTATLVSIARKEP